MNIKKLADELLGTCATLEIDDLTIEQCRELDDLVGCCDSCGWWVEACELNEDHICEDCC